MNEEKSEESEEEEEEKTDLFTITFIWVPAYKVNNSTSLE